MLAIVICPLSNADQPLIAFANILSLENPNNSTLRVFVQMVWVLGPIGLISCSCSLSCRLLLDVV